MHHDWDVILPNASNKRSKSVQAHQNNPIWEQLTRGPHRNGQHRTARERVCTLQCSARRVQMLYSGALWRPDLARVKDTRGADLRWHDSLRVLRDRTGQGAPEPHSIGHMARAALATRRRISSRRCGAPAINLYPFGADEDCGEGLTPAPPPNSVRPHQSDTRKRGTQTWLNASSRRGLLIRWTARRPPLQAGICAQAAHITEFQMAHGSSTPMRSSHAPRIRPRGPSISYPMMQTLMCCKIVLTLEIPVINRTLC